MEISPQLISVTLLLSLIVFLIFQLYRKAQLIKGLKLKAESLDDDNREAQLTLARLEIELKNSQEALANERRASIENNEQLKNTFRSLASEALDGNNKRFTELAQQILEQKTLQNKNELQKKQTAIDELIKPLKDSLKNYQEQVNEMEKTRQRSYSIVENELKRNIEINTQLSMETTALKDALKKPHVRGRWGEIQLKNCIDMAGISDYSDIQMQDAHTSEEKKVIPDMTVKMPGGHLVIVDAKTPIDAFLAYLEAKSDEEKKSKLTLHAQHLKDHIKKLSAKEYQNHIKGSADFTVMFLPNESFLYAALESQPDIMEYALKKKILIATPPTLVGLLKVICYGWNEKKLAENAQKISETGKELHKRVCDFLSAYTNVGKHLDRARDEYKVGLQRLEEKVIRTAKDLETLGAKSSKELQS